MKQILTVFLFLFSLMGVAANPIDNMLERIDKGASRKFKTTLVKSDKDFLWPPASTGILNIMPEYIFHGTA